MIDYASVGVVLLAAMIHATLQLSQGVLLLLYHASIGRHIRTKTRRLASRYIMGVTLMVVLVLSALCFIISAITGGTMSVGWLLVCVGILVGLAICAWFLYYRSGKSTELWLPRSVVKFINQRAKVTTSNTEAFSLGLLVGFAEMPFSLVLMVVAANSILVLPQFWQVMMILAYALVTMTPLLVLRFGVRRGRTIVEIQKWRSRNKTFFRVLSGVGFLTLAVFLVAFEIMGR